MTKLTVRMLPRATTPRAASVLLATHVVGADDVQHKLACATVRTSAGASARLIARAKALARTGLPSLKRKPLRNVNVYVFRSRATLGGPVATSGVSRNAAGGGLSGYDISRAQVVSPSAQAGAVYARAGST